MTTPGNTLSVRKSVFLQFVGKKLLFDLIQKVKTSQGLNQPLFLSVVTQFLLLMKSKTPSKALKKILKQDFLLSIRTVTPMELKKNLLSDFNHVAAFMLDDDFEKRPSIWHVGLKTGNNDSESDEKGGGSSSEEEEGEKEEDVEMEPSKTKKRKRETTSEDDRDEAKKARKDVQENVGPEEEGIFSLLTEDVWPQIFLSLPNMREILQNRMVNKQWFMMVNRLILHRFHRLLIRSDDLMRSLSFMAREFPKSLDLSYNNEITGETLSNFIYLTSLNLDGNQKNIEDNGLGTLVNLKKLTTGEASFKTLLGLQNLEELIYTNQTQKITFVGTGPIAFNSRLKDVEDQMTFKGSSNILKELGGPGSLANLKILRDNSFSSVFSKISSELTSLTELEAHIRWEPKSIGILTNLVSLSMNECIMIKDKELNLLTNLTYLETMAMPIDNQSISSLVNLETLKISAHENTISGDIFKTLRKIKTLKFVAPRTNITDEHLKLLENLTDLDFETYPGDELITGDFFRPTMRNGKLTGPKISRLIMHIVPEPIFDSSNLQFLIPTLTCLHAENVLFKDIAKLTNLTELRMREDRATYEGKFEDRKHAPLWKGLMNLKTLHLIGDLGWIKSGLVGTWDETTTEVLCSLTNLTNLRIESARSLSDECVEQLTNCSSLNLKNCLLITSASLGKLKNLTSLTFLFDLFLPHHSDQEKEDYMPLSNLVNLTELYLPTFYPDTIESRKRIEEKKVLRSCLLNLNGESLHRLRSN